MTKKSKYFWICQKIQSILPQTSLSKSNAENLIFGMRFGVPMMLCVFILLAFIMVCFGYIKYIRTNTLTWSEMFLGALSNLISPCVIQHQNSGMIAYFSSFVIMKFAITFSVFLALLHEKPSIWNSSMQLIMDWPLASIVGITLMGSTNWLISLMS